VCGNATPSSRSSSSTETWRASGSGAPIGNKNALRRGHYTAEAIARRRELSELIRMARDTLAELENGDSKADLQGE